MSDLQRITDFTSGLHSLMMEQYRHAPRMRGIIAAMGAQADQLEAALFELRDNFWLSCAVGAQLDIIGALFQEVRNGDDDTAYRARIMIRAGSRYSGTPEDILQALRARYPDADLLRYVPAYPAGFIILTSLELTKAELDALAPAGVEAIGSATYLVDGYGEYIVDGYGERIFVLNPI